MTPINSQHLQDLKFDFDKKWLRVCEEEIYADWLKLELDYVLKWVMEKIDLHKCFYSRYGALPWQKSEVEAHKVIKIDDADYSYCILVHWLYWVMLQPYNLIIKVSVQGII